MLSLSFIKEIEKIIGRENVLTGEADRQNYAYDAAVLPPVVPGLVVRPTRTDQLGPLIQKCYEEGIPITIRGSGTNLSGGTIPDSTDAVIILTNSLDRILEINEEEMYAVVEPGVITCDLAAAVAARGLFYPPDPGSMSVSTMGGNIAENSGGLRGLKYGTTKKYVMGLEVLTETGEIMKTGACGRGCEYGYNLTELLVASEGTLALTSKAVLKLVTPPTASNSGALEVVVAKDAAEKTRIWEARRVAIPALARCRPTLMLEYATVPRSKIPAMLEALDKIAARHHVTIGTFGHAGDGNLHPSILCDKRDKEEFSRVERAVDDLFNVALELGGTLSGEHGIGTSKKKWLELETSKGTLEYMRRMRSAFDPKKLLNASKIVSL